MPVFSRGKTFRQKLGAAGEEAAMRFYLREGCDVLGRDLRFPKGELDLVLRDGAMLVFAEVKTRFWKKLPSSLEEGRPADNLRDSQKRRIYRGAMSYLRNLGKERRELLFRFDIVEVFVTGWGIAGILCHKNSFGSRIFAGRTQKNEYYRDGTPRLF